MIRTPILSETVTLAVITAVEALTIVAPSKTTATATTTTITTISRPVEAEVVWTLISSGGERGGETTTTTATTTTSTLVEVDVDLKGRRSC